MIFRMCLLIFMGLIYLIRSGIAPFTFDGPFYHEILTGGLVDLPCYLSPQAKQIAAKSFTGPVHNSHTLRWVHRRFDRLVDPWTGDGRRSYLNIDILQASDPLVEDLGISNIPIVSGVGLRILSVNPSDAGLYACVISSQPFDRGLRLDHENATLLSIHSLRVTEVQGFGSEGVSRQQKGRFSGKGTPFDAWTWQIDPKADSQPDGTVFKIDCYADIALVGLVLRRVSSSMVRLGWKFVPRESQWTADIIQASKDETEWSLVTPEQFFHYDVDGEREETVNRASLQGYSEKKDSFEKENDGLDGKNEAEEGSWNLRTAILEATSRQWRPRWLRLDANLASKGSGTWQCWLEGLSLIANQSNKRGHMLISEIRVFEVSSETGGSFNTSKTWRVIAIWMVPVCCILVFLIAVSAWAAAIRWAHLLYHPPEKAKKPKKKKMEEIGPTKRLELLGLTSILPDINVEAYNFNEQEFTREYLKECGVPAARDKRNLIW